MQRTKSDELTGEEFCGKLAPWSLTYREKQVFCCFTWHCIGLKMQLGVKGWTQLPIDKSMFRTE